MAKRKFGEKSAALYRVVKFEVKFSKDEYQLIFAISEVLRELFNTALEERKRIFTEHIAPLYESLKSVAREGKDISEWKTSIRAAYKEHSVTLFDQINALTAKREADAAFGTIPRNWQEETLDMLDGAYKSFQSLRKNGDYDACLPRPKEAGFFQKIPGRFGFKLVGEQFVLSCGGGRKLSFPVPDYQQVKMSEAVKLKKFELYRDESDIHKPGRFWISVAYELPAPELTEFDPETAIYVALGASSIGILSPNGEETVKLWRPDKFWTPKIGAIEAEMRGCTKGSQKWRERNRHRRRMFAIMSAQQKQNHREIVDRKLLALGVHFVVSDLVVRSKNGKLADGNNTERGGRHGLNWAAQNTGSLGGLVLQLMEKVKEHGGSVQRHKLVLEEAPPGVGHENKLWMVRKLRDSFLESRKEALVS